MATVDRKYQVVIVFSGVVAIGPPLPKPQGVPPLKEKGPLFGVMPLSARRAVSFLNTEGHQERAFSGVHLPVIFTRLESSHRKPDERYRGFGIWYPVRERLSLTIDGDDTPGELTYVHDPSYGQAGGLGDPAGPLTTAIDDFAAIPDMRSISPARSKLHPDALDPRSTSVAVQVFIPSGTLRSGAEDKRRFGTVVTYQPATHSDVLPRKAVVVPQVRVAINVDKLLVINANSLDTGKALDPLSFPVYENSEIWIGNLDPSAIRIIIDRLVDPRTEYKEDVVSCDVDFARYYDMTDGQGNVVLPCDDPPNRGDRKCYTVTVQRPG